MTDAFDPYRIWLGIPAEEQPPNHYRLLGIGLFESDADVISNAADRQMTHVRTFQAGPHSALSQKLLNELAAARVTLLDPARRTEYEEQLRLQLVSHPVASSWTAAMPRPVASSREHRTTHDGRSDSGKAARPAMSASRWWMARQYVERRRQWSWQTPAVVVVLVFVLALTAWWLVRLTTPSPAPPLVPSRSQTSTVPPDVSTPAPPPQPAPAKTDAKPTVDSRNEAPENITAQSEPPAPSPPVNHSEPVTPTPPKPAPGPSPDMIAARATRLPAHADVTPETPKPVSPPESPSHVPLPVAPSIDKAALTKIEGFECRQEPARSQLLSALGGNEASQQAVRLAMDWLVAHQLADGSWDFSRIGSAANPGTLGAPHTATALVVLAMAGAGQCERTADHRTSVYKGAQYLIRRMKTNPTTGLVSETSPDELPSRPMAAAALCEVAASGHTRAMLDAAKSAVNLLATSQNNDGGWSATHIPGADTNHPSDIYATGWTVAALATAKLAHLDVPQSSLDRAGAFLDSLQTPDRAGYRRSLSEPLDADATPLGFLARVYLNWQPDSLEVQRYADQLARNGPRANGDPDFNYHATLLMRSRAGLVWAEWNTAMRDSLIARQVQEGPDQGSWLVQGREELIRQGGRLYCTAMAALILESYYRYPPPQALLNGP